MSDIFVQDQPFQGSSSPTVVFDYLETGGIIQGSSPACIVDLTAPTFAGIASLVVHSRGQFRATWLAGTDVTLPVRYEVYIKPTNATGLFGSINLIAITDKLLFDIFELPNGTFLENGVEYFVGVRAIDGVGNRDSNVISLSVISTGILTTVDSYECKGAFSVNSSNMFQGTLWILKNSEIGVGPSLLTAAYQVYNSSGTPVAGMGEMAITANSLGQFIITPTASLLNDSLDHYVVKISIAMDKTIHEGYIPIIELKPVYNIEGAFQINSLHQGIASFWVTEDEKIVTTNLGTASYQAYSVDGVAISGLSETGLTANANGVFIITPAVIPSYIDTSSAYNIKVTLTVNGVTKSDFIKVQAFAKQHQPVMVVSINALNQLEGTAWALVDGVAADPLVLGTASYSIHDITGAPVIGLSEIGITAGLDGLFHITPVSAALLTDLTHYTIHITINIEGADYSAFYAFSLLGN